VTDVSLTGVYDWDFANDIQRNNLQFSFVDGRVADVCAAENESTFALNVKRGILSAFQMSSEDWTKSQNITEVVSDKFHKKFYGCNLQMGL
jgi:Lipoprotein amino terminal region